MKRNLSFCLVAVLAVRVCGAQTISFDYFGQSPPGDTAVIFAPGVISLPNRLEAGIAFSPDASECFFTVWGTKYSSASIFYTKREGNVWSPQVEAPFSVGKYVMSPSLSADGNRLYYKYQGHIWMAERKSQWGNPTILPQPINSSSKDGGYSETSSGTAYFDSDRPGGQGKADIWRTRQVAGQPMRAENLGEAVNSPAYDAGPCVAPDESFVIFSSERAGGHSYSDLYVIFSKGSGVWTTPINIESNGAGINIDNKYTAQVNPSISPDGKCLFFARYSFGRGPEAEDIYWIALDKLIKNAKLRASSEDLI